MWLAAIPAHADGLTVGAIYVGSTNDYGYNQSMHDGMLAIKEAIPDVTLLEAENVPETAEAERVMEGNDLAGRKADLRYQLRAPAVGFQSRQKAP